MSRDDDIRLPTTGSWKFLQLTALLLVLGAGAYLAHAGGLLKDTGLEGLLERAGLKGLLDPAEPDSNTPLAASVPTEPQPSVAEAAPALDLDGPAADAPGEPTRPRTRGKHRKHVASSWECSGDVPRPAIREVMRRSQPTIRKCYERQLRTDNTLQGSVNLEVRIGKQGGVDGARVHGSLQNPNVRSCLRGLAREWSFPAPKGGECAVFTAPYNFQPAAAK